MIMRQVFLDRENISKTIVEKVLVIFFRFFIYQISFFPKMWKWPFWEVNIFLEIVLGVKNYKFYGIFK